MLPIQVSVVGLGNVINECTSAIEVLQGLAWELLYIVTFEATVTSEALVTTSAHGPVMGSRNSGPTVVPPTRLPPNLQILQVMDVRAADIVIGIVGPQIGSPTAGASDLTSNNPSLSETANELLSAYDTYRQTGKPEIILYRRSNWEMLAGQGERDAQPVPFDPQLQQQVNNYFGQLEHSGHVAGALRPVEYDNPDEFRVRIRQDLRKTINVLYQRYLKSTASQNDLYFAPVLEKGYVHRDDVEKNLINQLTQNLISQRAQSRTDVNWRNVSALIGASGKGKTMLARAICDETAIKETFKDGMFWVTLNGSDEAAILNVLQAIIFTLEPEASKSTTIFNARQELIRLIDQKSILFIVDNAASIDAVKPFLFQGVGVHTLIIAQDSSIQQQILAQDLVDGQQIPITLLDTIAQSVSLRVLQQASGRNVLPEERLLDICEMLHHDLLALHIAGRLLNDNVEWANIAHWIRHYRRDLNMPADVPAIMYASVQLLSPEERQAYGQLSVFYRSDYIPTALAKQLWQQELGLTEEEAAAMLWRLTERGLLSEMIPGADAQMLPVLMWLGRQDIFQTTFGMHELQRDYLQHVVAPAEQWRLHAVLADILSPLELLADDNDPGSILASAYQLTHLARHLHAAQQHAAHYQETLFRLLTNVAYLRTKLRYANLYAIVQEFALSPKSPFTLRRMQDIMQRSAEILYEYPEELYNQLIGRDGPRADLDNSHPRPAPYFELQTPTLVPPSSDLELILGRHTGAVNQAVLSPDERYVLSVGAEGDAILTRISNFIEHKKPVDAIVIRRNPASTGQAAPIPATCCAYSADGEQILIGYGDGIAHLYSLKINTLDELQPLRVLQPPREFQLRRRNRPPQPITACAISPYGTAVVLASADKRVAMWSIDPRDATKYNKQIIGRFMAPVTSCCYNKDGTMIIAAAKNGWIKIWNADGKHISTLKGPPEGINCVAFSADGNSIICGANDHTLLLFDTPRTLKVSRPDAKHIYHDLHTNPVLSCCFSPDGRTILSTAKDGTVIRSHVTGPRLQEFKGHTGQVLSCAFNAAGTRAITASSDQTARIWNIQNAQPFDTFHAQASIVSFAMSPDGQSLLYATADHIVYLWDIKTQQVVHEFPSHTAAIKTCAFGVGGADSKKIITTSDDQMIRVWYADDPMNVSERFEAEVQQAYFTPDGTYVISLSADNSVRKMSADLKDVQRDLKFKEHIQAMAVHPLRNEFITCTGDGAVTAWSADEPKKIPRPYSFQNTTFTCCVFSSDGEELVCGTTDGRIIILKYDKLEPLYNPVPTSGAIRACAVSPDMRHLVSISDDNAAYLWTRKDNSYQSRRVSEVNAIAACCAFLSDGRAFICGAGEKILYYDLQQANSHSAAIRALSFSADGKYLTSGSEDTFTGVWSATDFAKLHLLKGLEDWAVATHLSDDALKLMSVGEDNSIFYWERTDATTDFSPGNPKKFDRTKRARLWFRGFSLLHEGAQLLLLYIDRTRLLRLRDVSNINSQRVIKRYRWPLWWNLRKFGLPRRLPIVAACASDNQPRYVAAGTVDGLVVIWDGKTGKILMKQRLHDTLITAMAFSPDQQRLLTASADSTLVEFDLQPQRVIRRLVGHRNWVRDCTYSPDGRWALSVANDATLRLWNMTSPTLMPDEIVEVQASAFWIADAPLTKCAFHPDGETVAAGDHYGNIHFLRFMR